MPSAFFQDANYHDRIVKERKRVAAAEAAATREDAAGCQDSSIGRSDTRKLAERFGSVKRPGKTGKKAAGLPFWTVGQAGDPLGGVS